MQPEDRPDPESVESILDSLASLTHGEAVPAETDAAPDTAETTPADSDESTPSTDGVAAPPERDAPAVQTDGGATESQVHTVELELPDEPGQLLAALQPVARHGGNLLSVVHERGERTPRGRIPVSIDLECPPPQFDAICDGLREAGLTVVTADAEDYADEVVVVLVGHLVDTGLSDTLRDLRDRSEVTVANVSLSAPDADAREEPSAARVHLRTREGRVERALTAVREVADRKGLDVIEPLGGV